MPGIITTATHPQLLWPGIRTIWGQSYEQHAPEYTDLYDVETSTRAYEKDVQVTGFGLAPAKAQGAPIQYDGESQGWETVYAHIAYALGYIVTKEEIDDNQYKEVSQRRAKANAFSCNQTIENVCAFLYNNGFNTTYYTTPDGKAIFAADHVGAAGGTFSNLLATPADLSEAALEDMCIQIMNSTEDRGLKISIMPKSLHIPTAEWFNANRILKSVLQSHTQLNAINVLKAVNAFPGGIKVNHYFTDDNAWFVRTNIPNGMKMYWRTKPNLDQDNDFDTKNAKAASYFRMSVGVTDPRGCFGTPGA